MDATSSYRLRNRVKELRARMNLRQADLAKQVDVTRQTILAIEKGRLNPSIVVSLKIARVLNESVGHVFYLEHAHEAPLDRTYALPKPDLGDARPRAIVEFS